MQCVCIPTELPFCIPPTVVGKLLLAGHKLLQLQHMGVLLYLLSAEEREKDRKRERETKTSFVKMPMKEGGREGHGWGEERGRRGERGGGEEDRYARGEGE